MNFNYAIIAVGVVLVYSTATWFLPGPAGARKWFKGPNIDGLALAAVVDGGPGASMRAIREDGDGDVERPPMPMGV